LLTGEIEASLLHMRGQPTPAVRRAKLGAVLRPLKLDF
jgi:hypothetical protein